MSLDFFETVVIRTDSLKSNESAMLEQIYAFENYTHWLMHQSVEGMDFSTIKRLQIFVGQIEFNRPIYDFFYI